MSDKPLPPPGGQIYKLKIDAAMAPKTATLHVSTVRILWQKSWPWLILYLLVTFLSPLLGLYLTGWPGVGVGEVLAIGNLIIGFYAVTRLMIKEKH